MAKEFPAQYPYATDFIRASNVFKLSALISLYAGRDADVGMDTIAQVSSLMTPKAIIESPGQQVETINPAEFPKFDALLAERASIRDLRLLPGRTPIVQAEYNRMPVNIFSFIVKRVYVDRSLISLTDELYPYNLPSDVSQYVVWMHPELRTDYYVSSFIARVISSWGLTVNDIIMFERPRVAGSREIRAAFLDFRHIHLFTRKQRMRVSSRPRN